MFGYSANFPLLNINFKSVVDEDELSKAFGWRAAVKGVVRILSGFLVGKLMDMIIYLLLQVSFRPRVHISTLKCLNYFSLPFVHKGGPSGPPSFLSTFPLEFQYGTCTICVCT